MRSPLFRFRILVLQIPTARTRDVIPLPVCVVNGKDNRMINMPLILNASAEMEASGHSPSSTRDKMFSGADHAKLSCRAAPWPRIPLE